jgi:hypothetical protein
MNTDFCDKSSLAKTITLGYIEPSRYIENVTIKHPEQEGTHLINSTELPIRSN